MKDDVEERMPGVFESPLRLDADEKRAQGTKQEMYRSVTCQPFDSVPGAVGVATDCAFARLSDVKLSCKEGA